MWAADSANATPSAAGLIGRGCDGVDWQIPVPAASITLM